MNDPFGTAYADLREQLLVYVDGVGWPSPEAGFLHYLQAARFNPSRPLILERFNEAPILASNGYLYSCQSHTVNSRFNEEWSRAFERLLQRDPFPADRESYFYRPLELLGICIGAKHCPGINASSKEALRRLLRDGQLRANENDSWNFSIASFGAWQVGVNWKKKLLPLPEQLSLDELCLLHWLLRQKDFANDTDLDCPMEAIEERILKLCFTQCIVQTSPSRAGIILHVSEDLVDTRISATLQRTFSTPANTVAAQDVIATLARRFHTFALQLAVRHGKRQTLKIKDEYDVQDALHSLLKVHFEDVRPEECTASYAGSSTRMDFLLKRERIVVEAKMTRPSLNQTGILQELTEDIERYRNHPDCKTLVCFVYDPGGFCNNPTALEDDLRGNRDALKVIVHVFPKP